MSQVRWDSPSSSESSPAKPSPESFMARPSPHLPILIIGADISGLALAVGLQNAHIPFRLYEPYPLSRPIQAPRFRLSPDSIAALNVMLPPNLAHLFDRGCTRSKFQPRYVDAHELAFPEAVPEGKEGSMPVDYAWLRQLLMSGLNEGAAEYGKRFVRFEMVAPDHGAEGGVRALFEDGTASLVGSLLLGADGVTSKVRAQLQPERRFLDLERNMMWGSIPLTEELRRDLPEDLLTCLMVLNKTQNRQLAVEPMEWGVMDYVYFALATEPPEGRVQTAAEKRAYLMSLVEEWHPDVKRLLHGANHESSACVRVVSSKPDIETCGDKYAGRVLLLGGAAHPMSVMGGAGRDTAFINAADLCGSLAEGKASNSLSEVEGRMRKRAETKIRHSFEDGEKHWAGKKWFEYGEIKL